MQIIRILPILLSFLIVGFNTLAQKYVAENGRIDFTSNAELELIKASTAKVRGLLDPTNSQIAFTVDLQSFSGFNSALQREHFLEKYMEVHQYPKAEFAGKIIEHIDLLTEGVHDIRIKGTLDIHGQKQVRIIKGKIIVKKNQVTLSSDFVIPLSDHNISIPSIVNRKIATEIDVTFNVVMTIKQ